MILNRSTRHIDKTLKDATTPGQSRRESNGKEVVFYIPKTTGHSLGVGLPSPPAEM